MTCALKTGRNLGALEKEARKLLHDLQRMDPGALQRYSSQDPLAGTFQPGLADARYLVARQYGFRGWRELKQQLLDHARGTRSGNALSRRLETKSLASPPRPR